MKKKGCWIVLVLSIALASGCALRSPQMPPGPPPAVFHSAPPAEAQALWNDAEQEEKAGNIPSAVARLETIAQTYSDNAIAARALYKLADLSVDQGQIPQAIKYLDYLLYTYPQWEDEPLARVARLEAVRLKGDSREALKQGLAMWQSSAMERPVLQVPLALLIASAYTDTGDTVNGLIWLTTASTNARTPEDRQSVLETTLAIMKRLDEPEAQKLLALNPSDFSRVVLEYRLAQIENEKGQKEAAHQRLVDLLSRNPTHLLAPEMRATLGGVDSVAGLPYNPNLIGALVPLSGPYEKYGHMVLRGLALAAEEWNELHRNQPVTLIVEDTQAQPELDVKALEELSNKYGVLAVVGPISRQSTEALASVASRWGVPLLTLTQREENVSNPYIFHVFLDNEQMVRTMVQYCRDQLGHTNYAVLYPSDRYGKSLTKAFEKAVKESGGNLVASVPYEPKSTDFQDSIQKLIELSKRNPASSGARTIPFDALFVPDECQTVSLLAPQLPYNNIVGVTLLGTNLWGETPSINEVGGVYVENAVFVTPFYAGSQSSPVSVFRDKFQQLYQTTPSYLEAQAFDALTLLLQARFHLDHSTGRRPALIQNLLNIQGFQGVTGTVSFSPTGSVERGYSLFQVKNGGISQLVP